jgi:hypothetical protein
MKRKIIVYTVIIIAVAASPLVFLACKGSQSPEKKSTPAQAHEQAMVKKSFEESKKAVAARVNGAVITMFALLREMNAIAPQYAAGGQAPSPDLNAKIRGDALSVLIFQALAVQEAGKRGMKVPPETIDREVEKVRQSAGPGDAYQEYLSNNGLTEAELRRSIERDALFELIALHEVDAKITVTDAMVRDIYAKHKAQFVTSDAARRQMTFEEARGRLEQLAKEQASEKRMRAWEQELRKNARIEIVKK